MELYKKYRPKTFKGVVGCEETVSSLKNMMERNTLPHTILFHGPSGCGKTTLARVVSGLLDCDPMDLKELNCSDFRGIDTIREIMGRMMLSPVGKSRIWILDEVHQLSKDAQNAALKMLEDTPNHVYFFLCTTDPQKLINTIRTRCCEMPVRLLTDSEIEFIVKRVIKHEDIEVTGEAVEEIVLSSQGSARTALVLLDKASNLKPEDQLKAIEQKLRSENEALDLCKALIRNSGWSSIASILKELKQDPESVRYSVLGYARTVMLNDKKPANRERAFVVIDAFSGNFFDSKNAGLAAACYEVSK